MRITAIIFVFAFIACNSSDPQKEGPGNHDQEMIARFSKSLFDCSANANNTAKETDCLAEYKQKINSYLNDTLKGSLIRFKVRVDKIQYLPWQGQTALLFSSSDDNAEFWSELHFANEDSMRAAPLYKLITSFKEGTDTNISFIYIPDVSVKKEPYLQPSIKIQVLPVPDSIAIALRKR